MDFKTFWKESTFGYITKRLLLAILLFIAIAWVSLYFTGVYTHHGESVPVPDLRGLYMEEASAKLNQSDLYIEVIDSVYMSDKALGTIVDQIPAPGSTVKKNRAIYLIVNKQQKHKVPVPEVSDLSYRQADALLKSLGLKVSSVIYRPSEYKDLVIDVLYDSVSISSGTRLPEGSSVVLVVGSGLGSESSYIPSLIGVTLESGRKQAIGASFVIGARNFDTTPDGDEAKYMIYKQEPAAGEVHPTGTRIDIWLSKDKDIIDDALQNAGSSENDEEQFF